MTNDELQQAIEANTRTIAQVSRAIDTLVTQFIRPNAQQALSNYERIERIEAVLESNTEAIGQIESIQAENAQQVAQNTRAITALTQLSEANQQQIADNAEAINPKWEQAPKN